MTANADVALGNDLFFGAAVNSYIGSPRFLRRDWLADEVWTRLEKPKCRLVLLTAEPGAGKSAFAAQMSHDHPDWLRYFIRRDQRMPLANAGARSFLTRIGFQLAETHPDLFARDDILLDVEQEIGAVGERGAVLGIDIKKLVASPFYRQVMVKVRQTIEQTSGSIKGIQIDTVIADPRLLSANDLQEVALFDPARRLQAKCPQRKIVVLVDALDELHYHDTKDNILQWLTGCPTGDLPANVRFVLTSRPPDKALRLLYYTQKPHVERITLELDEEQTAKTAIHVHLEKDARTYADQLVALAALEPYWAEISRDPAAFAADAVAKAEGNLGYLDAIARALDQAIAQDDETTIRALLSLRELPGELEDLYVFFMSQVQERVTDPHVKIRAPDTGEAAYVGVWDEICLPVLGLLSVALAPLTTQQIHKLVQIGVSLAVMSSHLDRLRNFLDPVGDGYRLYHSSFAEFLAGPGTAETPPGLFCDPLEWYRYIADGYWRIFQTHPETCDQYGWRYLPAHLKYAEQVERLRQLLLSFDWLQAKLDATDVAAVLIDYELLRDDADLNLIQGALRLSAHVLVRDRQQLPGQLLGRLLGCRGDAIKAPLTQASQRQQTTWLRPLKASLAPPRGPQIRTLSGHTDVVWAVALTPDGRRAVSGSRDSTLKLWDPETGDELATLSGRTGGVWALAVTPDGRRGCLAQLTRRSKCGIWKAGMRCTP